MYIKKVKIKNYRNFGEATLTLKLKPFTLILGENNIGKTNLLNALGLIFSQEISIFRNRMLEIDDINYDTVRSFKEKICNPNIIAEKIDFPEVRIEAILTGMNKEQEAVVGDWFINKELTEAKITYSFAPKAMLDKTEWVNNQRKILGISGSIKAKEKVNRVDFPISEYRYSIFGGNDSANECEMYYLRMLKMEFLDALRDAQQELVAGGGYRLLYRILSSSEESKYENIKTILENLEGAVDKNESLNKIKEQIKSLLDKVSLKTADVDNRIGFNFSSPETREILKKISLIYGANPIDVSRNGLGRNNLLYISLVLSHLSAKEMRGGDTYFRIIGIEEPEAHLHPHLEDHLSENIEAILKDNKETMQLLLTSHSTHVASKLKLKNTVIMFNNRNKGKIDRHYILSGIDAKKDKKSIQYLSTYLDATKSRMFFAQKLILVEGISEQILIPEFFKSHFGSGLEHYGCEIINVSGVAFSHFLKIIRNGYFVKCLVLTDRDTNKRSEKRADKLKEMFEQEGLIKIEISTQGTFEKDLIEANKDNQGKKILLRTLERTKSKSGRTFKEKLGDKDIDTEQFFNEIENYKTEFAFNLRRQLKRHGERFVIPKYIKNGLKFLSQ